FRPAIVRSGSGAVLKLGCPSTTFAGVSLAVGIVFQINTRWFCESATYSLPSWIHTPCGRRKLLASTVTGRTLVKFACPSTTSAGCALLVGRVSQISTRLFCVSATTRLLPSEAMPVGLLKPVRVRLGSVVVKVARSEEHTSELQSRQYLV